MNAEFEYRIDPDDPRIVQVRRISTKRHGNNNRGPSWYQYMDCATPADARRILAMLGA